jgi:hypothetical protein
VKWVLFGVLFCSSYLWAGSGPQPSQALVITNVNVVDTRSGVIHPGMTVAIKNDKIAAIGKVAITKPGPSVQVVNGNGGFLIPGLWDMNTHLRLAGTGETQRAGWLELYLAQGVTGIRDLDAIQKKGEVVDPGLRPDIEEEAAAPSDSRSTLRHSIENLDDVFIACQARPSDLQQRGVADKLEPVSAEASETYDPAIAYKTFLELSDNATWVVPSLVASEASSGFSHSALEEAAVREPENGAVPIQAKSHFQRARELVRAMHRAGVQLLAGTNGPSGNGRPRATVQRELELLVESGLTPLEALQAATFNPALYMVKLDRYGVVAPAHVADLVLLEANPLEDIRNLRRIEGVVMRGHYFSRPDLNRMLSQALEQIEGQKNTVSADSE